MDLLENGWTCARKDLRLKNGDLHIWKVNLEQADLAEKRYLQTLSPDEKQRASRYFFEKDSSRFTFVRGALREVLAGYISVPAAEVTFSYNDFGKPKLAGSNGEKLNFSVSYSRQLVLFACTLDVELGIDVEFVDADFPKTDVADRYFTKDEVFAIRDLPVGLQTRAFFNCWTVKEAYVKAIGEGLSHSLPDLVISSDAEAPHSYMINAYQPEKKGWLISSFIPEPNYIASFAYRGTPEKIQYLKWSGIDS